MAFFPRTVRGGGGLSRRCFRRCGTVSIGILKGYCGKVPLRCEGLKKDAAFGICGIPCVSSCCSNMQKESGQQTQ